MAAPTVSILTSFFNAEPFLDEAVESILSQTFDDWELLLIDDGSTDGSTARARGYAERHPGRIRYFDHDGHVNRGISASQNAGLREAAGEYIAILDSDDVWAPTKLAEQMQLMRSQAGAVMLYGDTFYWYSWTGHPDDAARDRYIPAGLPPGAMIEGTTFLTKMLRREIPVPCPSDILIRRDAALRSGGFEDQLRLFTDQAFYWKLCLHGSVLVGAKCWFKYRKHPDSSIALARERGQLDARRLVFLTWLSSYVREQQAAPDVQRLVRSMRWTAAHPSLSRMSSRGLSVLRALARRVRHLVHSRRRPRVTPQGGDR